MQKLSAGNRLAALRLGALLIGGGSVLPDPLGPVVRKSPVYAVPPVHGRSPDPIPEADDKTPVPEKEALETPENAPGKKEVGGPGTPVGSRKERRQAMKLHRMIENRKQAFQRTIQGFQKEAEKARENARGQDQDLHNALADRPDLVAAIQKTFKELVIRHPEWSRNQLMRAAAGCHGVVVSFTDKGKIGR